MNKVVTVSLDSQEINQLIERLNNFKSNISESADKIARETAYNALTYLDMQYAETPYNENVEDINTYVEKTADGYKVVASGKDVIYAEFGTGDLGEQNPHPEKDMYSLNPYNSGETIRDANEHSAAHGITSGKYWTYKKNDVIYYTQGIPAGKQMFNTRNYVLKEGLNKSIKKVVGDALSKL